MSGDAELDRLEARVKVLERSEIILYAVVSLALSVLMWLFLSGALAMVAPCLRPASGSW